MTAPTLDLYGRRCPECDEPLTKPRQVRCCCDRCKHKIDDHSPGLDCRICGERCGIDCPPWRPR